MIQRQTSTETIGFRIFGFDFQHRFRHFLVSKARQRGGYRLFRVGRKFQFCWKTAGPVQRWRI